MRPEGGVAWSWTNVWLRSPLSGFYAVQRVPSYTVPHVPPGPARFVQLLLAAFGRFGGCVLCRHRVPSPRVGKNRGAGGTMGSVEERSHTFLGPSAGRWLVCCGGCRSPYVQPLGWKQGEKVSKQHSRGKQTGVPASLVGGCGGTAVASKCVPPSKARVPTGWQN